MQIKFNSCRLTSLNRIQLRRSLLHLVLKSLIKKTKMRTKMKTMKMMMTMDRVRANQVLWSKFLPEVDSSDSEKNWGVEPTR